MSIRAKGKEDRVGRSSNRKTYDKELVRERTIELLTLRLGTGKDQGARLVWDCPECAKQEKYSVQKIERRGGCLVAGCRLSGYDDVFGMLAKLENLNYHADFPAVLARSYELLGLEPTVKRRAPAKGGRAKAGAQSSGSQNNSPNAETSGGSRDSSISSVPVPSRAASAEEPPRQDFEEILALASRVYARILDLCPLESRDRGYLRKRGLSYETIRAGRFGTMTASRARNVKAALQREVGREQLLTVPGFSEDKNDGRLKWTLTGDYVLIPYHDTEGRITTIEGRVVGEHKGSRKYVTLRRAGNHLYLFPGCRPEDLQAVTEGAMGAIVAAECGFTVGAIQGCERFRASPSPEMLDGAPGDPLLELKDTDFGGRVIPYVPDADDPPNPNVLRAAPKAACWIAEPQNGKAAICLLPRGTDLDEWLLALEPEERPKRFAELLARATPPENGSGTIAQATYPRLPEEVVSKSKVTKNASKPGEEATGASKSQPSPQDGADAGTAQEDRKKSGVSRGARKLRDEVYRSMLDALPLKAEHLEALERRGVKRATANVGRFASVDPEVAERMAPDLVERFGAKKLRSVPGFETVGTGKVHLSFAAGEIKECVLVPCFDADGLLAGVEGLAFDSESGEIEVEETVSLEGAESHLYVFAHYAPREIEGFCEGLLGAMLAAQEDVVIGAIGDFRRYKAGDGFARGRQSVDSSLLELEGVDFDGRKLAYAPRAGGDLGEANARYHEAASAARWLVERQGGEPVVVGFGGEEKPASVPNREEVDTTRNSPGSTSLGEWILTLPEDEAWDRLRELFPESPAREDAAEGSEGSRKEEEVGDEDEPPPLSRKLAYFALALAVVTGAVIDLLIGRLHNFAGYVTVGSSGEQLIYAGTFGQLRRLADSALFHVLYELHWFFAIAGAAVVMFAIIARGRKVELARWRAARVRLGERWELHLSTTRPSSSGVIITRGEAIWCALAWPIVYVVSTWLISGTEFFLSLGTRLRMIPPLEGSLVADSTLASVYAATAFSVFVLWRRRSLRIASSRMFAGRIRH